MVVDGYPSWWANTRSFEPFDEIADVPQNVAANEFKERLKPLNVPILSESFRNIFRFGVIQVHTRDNKPCGETRR